MIKVKILDILKKKDRNINWLAKNANVNYSTLYNLSHNKTTAVKFEILDNLCEFLNCKLTDIIDYFPNTKDEN